MNNKRVIGLIGMAVIVGSVSLVIHKYILYVTDIDVPMQVAAVEKARKPQKEKKEHVKTKEEHDSRIFNTMLQSTVESFDDEGNSSEKSKVHIAKERAKTMKELAKTDPQAFLRNVISSKEREKFSKEVQDEIEMKTTVEGAVEVLHIDDFSDEKKSRFEYHVRQGKKRIAVYFANDVAPMMSGSVVKVSGYQLGDSVVSAGGTEGITIVTATQPESVGAQRTLFVLLTRPGETPTVTKPQMQTELFSGSFQQFYKEQSYNKISFAGDVTDWITVPFSESTCYDSSPLPDFELPAIGSYMTQRNINLSNYDRVVMILNNNGGGCAYVGKLDWDLPNGTVSKFSQGWVGWPNGGYSVSGSNLSGFGSVLSHEMGHELGVMHANAWGCEGPSLDTNCYHYEYGNYYDTMGYGQNSKHFNAFYKDILGWFDLADKVTITQTGQYQLAPLEAQSGVRAGIIRNPALSDSGTQPLYVEFRKPIGFDATLPASGTGIHINQVILPYTNAFPMTRLINANYVQDPYSPEPLLPGGTFNWDTRGISIGSVTTATGTATFGVTLGTPLCRSGGIDIRNEYSDTTIPSGGWGSITYLILNNDSVSCSPSSVSFTSAISPNGAGWDIESDHESSFVLSPGSGVSITVAFNPPLNMTPGTVTLTTNVTDTTHAQTYKTQDTITVVARPKITAITPTNDIAGRSVTLTGTDFAVSPETNSIYIERGSTWTYLENISTTRADKLSFVFPTTIDDGNGITIPTTPGTYSIQAIRDNDYGYSDFIPFVVTSPAEITVSGGGINIVDGDTTPIATDLTNFGSVLQNGTAITRVFTVKNEGTGTLTLSLSSSTLPQGFALVDPLVLSLEPGVSDTFSVRLLTTTPGTKTGQITFKNNDSNENPFNFSIVGVVTAPEIEVLGNGVSIVDGDTTPSATDRTDYGLVLRAGGASPTYTYTVKNTGTATLTTSGLAVPVGFTVTEVLSPTIAPGLSDTFSVRLDLISGGSKTGQITFTNNDSNENPFNFSIVGSVF